MRKRDGTIEISGATYKLKYVTGLTYADGSPIWGVYKAETREIHIEAKQSTVGKRNTLLHEIGHAILEHAGLGPQTLEANEAVTCAFAYGLESVKVNGKRLLR